MNRQVRNVLRLTSAGCLALGWITSVASAISIRHDVPVASFNALALQSEFQAAGYLGNDGGQFCTGALVSPNHILTASHCIDEDSDGVLDNSVVLSNLGFGFEANVPGSITPNVASAAINPQWASSNGDPQFDVAVLTLSSPITEVTPARITSLNPAGKVGTMIGYGEQGLGDFFPDTLAGANNRLAAQNIIDASSGLVQIDFDSPTSNTSSLGSSSPIALEGTTGPGDSGGPIFTDFNGISLIVGTLNGGANDVGGFDSEYGDASDWAALRNPQNLAFLAGFGITPFLPTPGDYNQDGKVDSADYTVWRDNFGSTSATNALGDTDGDNDVDGADFLAWQTQFGTSSAASQDSTNSIPEPSTLALGLSAAAAAAAAARRKHANRSKGIDAVDRGGSR